MFVGADPTPLAQIAISRGFFVCGMMGRFEDEKIKKGVQQWIYVQ